MFKETLRTSAKTATFIVGLSVLWGAVRTLERGTQFSVAAESLVLISLLWPVVFIIVATVAFLYVCIKTKVWPARTKDGQRKTTPLEREPSSSYNDSESEVDVDTDFEGEELHVEEGTIVEPDEKGRPTFDLSDPDAVSYCPSCGDGYRPEAIRCVDCDVELLPRSVIEGRKASDEPRRDFGVTVPFCRADQAEAWLLGAELEHAGIPFFTKEHAVQGMPFGGARSSVIEFFVPKEKIEEAESVLSNLEDFEDLTDAPGDLVEPEEGGERGSPIPVGPDAMVLAERRDPQEQVLEPKPEVEPDPAREGRRTDRELWIETAVVILVGVLPPLASALSFLYWPSPSEWPPFNYDSTFLIVNGVSISAVLLYFIWRSGEGFPAFGLVKPRWMDLPLGVAVLWVERFLWVTLWPLLMPWIGRQPQELVERPEGAIGHSLLLLSLATAAFGEELLLRGYLLFRLKYLLRSAAKGLLLTTFLFASYHVYRGLIGLVSAAIAGLVFGVAFLRFKRLWPVVFAHALGNVLNYLP
jgi:membrane protease YdiL (CAAX protease family)